MFKAVQILVVLLMRNEFYNHTVRLLLPCVVFSAITGFFAAILITAFKIAAEWAVHISASANEAVRENPIWIPILIIGAALIGLAASLILSISHSCKGGGIPTSVAAIQGIFSFRWLPAIILLPVCALLSFLAGLPLGTEGPCVQMGTAVGDGVMKGFGKEKHRGWRRYIMTGGASAGFSIATASPISAILFAMEELHKHFSPILLSVASISVITAQLTAEAAGAAGREYLLKLIEALHTKDTAAALAIVAELHDASKDLARLCEELILMLRDVMLLRATGDGKLAHCMADELPALQKIAAETDMDRIMAVLELLQGCRERMGRAVNRRVELEMTLIRATQTVTQSSADVQALSERIAQLESRPAAAAPVNPGYNPELTKPRPSPAPEPAPEVDIKKLKMEDFKPVAEWPEILEECGKLNPAVLGTLSGSTAVAYANVMLITAENAFFLTMFKEKENAKTLGDAVQKVMGRRYAIRARCSQTAAKQRPIEEMLEQAKNSGIPTTAV